MARKSLFVNSHQPSFSVRIKPEPSEPAVSPTRKSCTKPAKFANSQSILPSLTISKLVSQTGQSGFFEISCKKYRKTMIYGYLYLRLHTKP